MIETESRQSFLGLDSPRIFSISPVSIVGLSGGGSHIAQQLAHVGTRRFTLIDPKLMARKHLHRIVGATEADVSAQTPKVEIARRTILSIQPEAQINAVQGAWQLSQLALRSSVAIFGCVDSYSEREQLERFCRRFLIPYVDIGMDVLRFGETFRIVGQVAMSSPGHACLRCMGIITDENLKQEAAAYGAAGSRAQVIWPNAILAASAVGLFVQLVCPWHTTSSACAYLEYNGNTPSLIPSPRMEYAINHPCEHYPIDNIGDPMFSLESPATT